MRISFETMAMEIAKISSLRSEDKYKKVGCAVLNEEGRLLSIGYNGTQPKQAIHDEFWSDRDSRRQFMIHAEINALSCISRYDKPHLLASTLLPCSSCATTIAAHNIKKVLYLEEYDKDQKALDIFKFYNIKLIRYNN